MKSKSELAKNWLQGRLGDALQAILCGAAHNLRRRLNQLRLVAFYILCFLLFSSLCFADSSPRSLSKPIDSGTAIKRPPSPDILKLLGVIPSLQSKAYVNNKQFQLHTLLTEQRHPETFNLSSRIKQSTVEGLASLLAVDVDISEKFKKMAEDPK